MSAAATATEPHATSGDSSSSVSEYLSVTEQQAYKAMKSIEAASPSDETLTRPASLAIGHPDVDQQKTTGWLVTSCDVGTAEPRSLSQELERLQVLKSYHIMDPERDESFDLLIKMASRILETPYTFLSLVDMGRIWFRCNPDSDCEKQLTRDLLSALARVIMKHDAVFDIPDMNVDDMFRQGSDLASSSVAHGNADSSATQCRFFAGAPLMSPEGYRLGAVCMLSTAPRVDGVTAGERENLKDLSELAVKTMVDRRKLTTQGSPSHLVACTAHDLITPLTGIQLSLSLLQQDGDFQEKLGAKRKEHISAAVRSSNMMLRICQSTIETLRGRRKIPASTDWSLPRDLMQIAEASPFIDMREFTANLKVISNSIPKRVPLKVTLHPSAPFNIISDGLKIFRSALNLLSNACARADSGSIVMTIFDDQDGSLVFECEDSGREIEIRDSQSLFNQDNDSSNFGLYSVAYQVNWLGGKYGVRKRDESEASLSEESGGYKNDEGNDQNNDKTGKKCTIFWFSIPIVLPQDVSELMGLARSLSDNAEEASISTFKAKLPVTPPASPQTEDSQPNLSPAVPEGIVKKSETTRRWNALIIEDSTTVRKILGRALSNLGYHVFEAVDGMEGLRELKTTMFDMVLCDFLMPVMDGLDCVKQYREWEETNRQVFRQYIVGISAHASHNDIERGLKLGMDDFKPKPIVLKTLTGLHESAALRLVRAKLDSLLDLPSLEVRRRHILSTGIYTVPSEHEEKGEEGSAPLFAIPGPRGGRSISSDETNRAAPLFAVPRRPSKLEKDARPLFSIPLSLTESERKLQTWKSSTPESLSIQAQCTSIQKPQNGISTSSPLFPLAPIETNIGQAAAKGGGVTSVPASQKGVDRPSPLFLLPTNKKRELEHDSPKGAVLSSISDKPTETTGKGIKRPALFSLKIFHQDVAKQNIEKPDLCAYIENTTVQPSTTKTSGAPLFSVATKPTPEGVKPAALISLSPNAARSSENTRKEREKFPFFSFPGNASQKDGKSIETSKPAPSVMPESSSKPSLFDMPIGAKGKNGGDSTRASMNPALFKLPGEGSKTDIEVKRNKDKDDELADGDKRPKKAMKRALFDITTRTDEK